jgi:hypothetical protein
MKAFIRGCGLALLLAGVLTILINVIVAPLMFSDHTSAVRETTNIFLLRQSASGVAALLLIFGCLGVERCGRKLGTLVIKSAMKKEASTCP